MAKRTKKNKSNLKLEALETRQLLAGVTGAGTEVGSNITHPNGNVYDQVRLDGGSVTVTADPGQITRVSFLDASGDIVQAEFSGKGSLTVSMDTFTTGNAPTGYNQSNVNYVKGLASFTITGEDATTNFNVFSVGSGNAAPGNTLFDATHTGGSNHLADVQRLSIVADPANPNGSTFGSIFAGNAVFSGTAGVVGISAANVQVQGVVRVGDIDASGTATPTLTFGTNSQFGSVDIQGGDLAQTNGKSVFNTNSYAYTVNFVAGADSTVASGGTANLPAQTPSSSLSFSGTNPITAATKVFTLTSSVDSVTGTSGDDVINGQLGSGATLTALDTIDGSAGTDTLNLNDVTGGQALPGGITIKNVEKLNLASVGTVSIDTTASGITGLQSVTVTSSTGNDTITAGAGHAVTVFDTAGTVTVTGGSTQSVTTKGGLVLSGASGAITGTDTGQGLVATTINGGTTVNLTNSAAGSSSGNTLVETVTFGALTANQTVTVLGLTYDDAVQNAGAGSTATQVATFFASKSFTPSAGVSWTSGVNAAGVLTFTSGTAGTSNASFGATGTGAAGVTTAIKSQSGTITVGGTTAPTGAVTIGHPHG